MDRAAKPVMHILRLLLSLEMMAFAAVLDLMSDVV